MDNQTPTPPSTSTTATPLPTQPPPSQPPQSQPPPSPALPSPQPPQPQKPPPPSYHQPPSSAPSLPSFPTPTPNPTPNPNPKPNPIQQLRPSISTTNTTTTMTPQVRGQTPVAHRPQHQHFQHFSSITSASPQPRPVSAGGVAIGVPAAAPAPFSSSFGQVRPMSSAGVGGSQIRGSGIGGVQQHHHLQRPISVQSSVRPPAITTTSPNNQSPAASQHLQGHGFMRSSSLGPGSPAPNTSQSMHSPNQPWLSSGSQGKPPLPSHQFRAQLNSPSVQHRSPIPQPHHSLPTISHQQHVSPAQTPQSLSSHPPSEHFGQPFPSPRVPRSITQQLALQNLANQRPTSLTAAHPSTTPSASPNALPSISPHALPSISPHALPSASPNALPGTLPNAMQSGIQNRTSNAESYESGNRILSKRSIHELVTQIDPFEKLDPEVEDVLADIADEFVESITTFGCSLAKHRKSDTLEAKDILLHLERNWNMSLPGFSSDEIKTYRKPLTSDLHKERLAMVKKSMLASEMAGAKNSVGQAAGNTKGNLTRTPANVMISPNVKVHEVT